MSCGGAEVACLEVCRNLLEPLLELGGAGLGAAGRTHSCSQLRQGIAHLLQAAAQAARPGGQLACTAGELLGAALRAGQALVQLLGALGRIVCALLQALRSGRGILQPACQAAGPVFELGHAACQAACAVLRAHQPVGKLARAANCVVEPVRGVLDGEEDLVEVFLRDLLVELGLDLGHHRAAHGLGDEVGGGVEVDLDLGLAGVVRSCVCDGLREVLRDNELHVVARVAQAVVGVVTAGEGPLVAGGLAFLGVLVVLHQFVAELLAHVALLVVDDGALVQVDNGGRHVDEAAVGVEEGQQEEAGVDERDERHGADGEHQPAAGAEVLELEQGGPHAHEGVPHARASSPSSLQHKAASSCTPLAVPHSGQPNDGP